jgi:hypothetical protein
MDSEETTCALESSLLNIYSKYKNNLDLLDFCRRVTMSYEVNCELAGGGGVPGPKIIAQRGFFKSIGLSTLASVQTP